MNTRGWRNRPNRTGLAATCALACLIVLSGLAATAPPAAALEYGARAYALGGAATAAVDDVSALHWNPAALGQQRFEVRLGAGGQGLQAVQELQQLLADPAAWEGQADVTARFLAGVGLGRLAAGSLVEGWASVERQGIDVAEGAGEVLISVVLAGSLPVIEPPGDVGTLRVGLAVRALRGERLEFEASPDGIGGYTEKETRATGTGHAADLGILLHATQAVTLGAVARNLTSQLSWEGSEKTTTYDGTGNPTGSSEVSFQEAAQLPLEFWAGVAFRPLGLGATLSADIGPDGVLRYGVEKSFLLHALAVRVGRAQSPGGALTTAGLGLNLGPLRLDAAAGTADFQTYHVMVEGAFRF